MLREYAVSEAMHALGVPTTRALAVVATGRPVRRAGWQPGALLARTAASHLRVGSFQYAAALPERADPVAVLRRLVDEAILRHHPHAAEAENPALALYEAVIAAQAELVARWMLVGFVHGVMNTDNMTLSGETIDYGPCAFLDAFDPAASFSSIDTQGRYAFGNQGPVAAWNLARLGEALVPVLDDDAGRAVELAQEALGGFQATHLAAWRGGLRAKLGLSEEVTDADVAALTDRLFPVLAAARTDWTGFWVRLAEHVPGARAGARGARAAPDGMPGGVPERASRRPPRWRRRRCWSRARPTRLPWPRGCATGRRWAPTRAGCGRRTPSTSRGTTCSTRPSPPPRTGTWGRCTACWRPSPTRSPRARASSGTPSRARRTRPRS